MSALRTLGQTTTKSCPAALPASFVGSKVLIAAEWIDRVEERVGRDVEDVAVAEPNIVPSSEPQVSSEDGAAGKSPESMSVSQEDGPWTQHDPRLSRQCLRHIAFWHFQATRTVLQVTYAQDGLPLAGGGKRLRRVFETSV